METVVDIVGGEEVKKLESADPVVYQLVRVHLYALVLDNVNGRSFIFFLIVLWSGLTVHFYFSCFLLLFTLFHVGKSY